MFNDLTSISHYLATRRSGKARELVTPGPDNEELGKILALAARTPDHGKLFPWRFVIIEREQRTAFAHMLETAFLSANPDARPIQVEAATAMAHLAPSLIILLHAPQESSKINAREQLLSTGAVAMNLLHAAHAHGYVANWITGWAAYDENVRRNICEADEDIAGFFFIGTAQNPLEERPRPEMEQIVRHWPPGKP